MSKVAIVMPCYNDEPFIAEALDSVLAQTSGDWECVFVNDGSTDGSEAVARRYAERDRRVVVLSQNNAGIAAARNAGVRASTAPYILPLDADDRIAPGYVRRAAALLDARPEVDLVYGPAELFGAKQGPWELAAFDRQLLLFDGMIYCSAVYRRTGWQNAGGYDEQMKTIKQGFEDWDLWLSMLEKGRFEVAFLDELVFHYRIQDESIATALSRDKTCEQQLLEYLFSRHRGLYEDALGTPFHVYEELFWTKRSAGYRWLEWLRTRRDQLRRLGVLR